MLAWLLNSFKLYNKNSTDELSANWNEDSSRCTIKYKKYDIEFRLEMFLIGDDKDTAYVEIKVSCQKENFYVH